MGKKHNLRQRGDEPRSFEAPRTIDVSDQQAMRFWSQKLGVTTEEIAEAVKEVGPNSTAVELKLEAPQEQRLVPPSPPLR